MFCSNCGAQVADNVKFCSNCGTQTSMQQASGVPAAPVVSTGHEKTSGKAIGSLVCGIINIFPMFVVAVILGHMSISEINKSGGRLKGRGLAIAGLVLGYLGVVAIPFILIIAAIAIPNLLRAKISANEASAIGSVRKLITAEATYQTQNAQAGFTCNLSDLARLVGPELASGERYGYRFTLQNCSAEKSDTSGSTGRFQVLAVPVTFNSTGVRAFCADESGMIRMDTGGSGENCLESGTTMQ